MSAAGERLFARYAYSPNDLGYCGPAGSEALFALASTGRTDADVVAIARRFSGAWPYLALLAELRGRADPLAEDAVRAYWTGGLSVDGFGAALIERLGARAGHYWKHLDEALLPEAAPDHGFHVFGVYPWTRLLLTGPPGPPLHVLDSCRVSWGRVVRVDGDTVVVARRPLAFALGRLVLLPEHHREVARGFVVDPRPGDLLALHWDWVCDRLTADDVNRMERSTVDRLAVTNERLNRGAAAAATPG